MLTWARRYGAAEVTGTLTAYLGYFTMLGMTQNDVALKEWWDKELKG